MKYSNKPTKIRQRLRFVPLLLVLTATVQGLFLLPVQQTNAAGVLWSGGSPKAVSVAPDVYPSYCRTPFQNQVVAGVPGEQSMCIMGQSEKMRVGVYPGGPFAYAVGFGFDSKMYKTFIPCGGPYDCLYLPATDTLLSKQNLVNGYIQGLVVYKNLSTRLHGALNLSTLVMEYSFDSSNPDLVFKSSDGYAWGINGVGASDNGKWAVVEVVQRGIALLNIETLEMKRVSTHSFSYWTGMNPSTEMAVSNDGEHFVVTGANAYLTVFDTPPTCGDESNDYHWYGNPMADDKKCPTAVINFDSFMDRFRNGYAPSFNYDGGELTFYASSYVTTNPIQKITLRAVGYVPPKLDYLAMGDSYSSGEGDLAVDPLTQKKYYRNFTNNTKSLQQNVPQEKCHISTRAYPYRLARSMDLALDSPKQWDSIACAGATTWDVRGQASDKYQGQGDRLKDFDSATLKSQALNDFIPGRQKQIEFVKKYKPKVITLTMGGNDIGFGEKIKSCAVSLATCSYASMPKNESLGTEIRNQYDNLLSLYNELYTASDSQAKIYAIGYPKFINGGHSANCPTNVGLLNSTEREMIDNSIDYLNRVIKKAADAAGVKYVDIENSLSGHRLCDDGEAYVTGVALGYETDLQESFHPNATGNAVMAVALWDDHDINGQSLADFDICPNSSSNSCPDDDATKDSIVAPSYFGSPDESVNSKYSKITADTVAKGSSLRILVGPMSLMPGSSVQVTLHSDPISLGAISVDSDGQLDANLQIPTFAPIGYHTLSLSGSTYSGEPIQLEQVVLIIGSNNGDIDDNDIPDSKQGCLFIPQSSTDNDRDGIDDACDPEITNTLSTPSNHTGSLVSKQNQKNPTALQPKVIHEKTELEQKSALQSMTTLPLTDRDNDIIETHKSVGEQNFLHIGLFILVGISITIILFIKKSRQKY